MTTINLNKYQSFRPAQTKEGGIFPAWQYKTPVVFLVEYLRRYRDKGIFLYRDPDGSYRLHFYPGLMAQDIGTERWAIAAQAYDYLLAAKADMEQLFSVGHSVPFLHMGHNNGAGPF